MYKQVDPSNPANTTVGFRDQTMLGIEISTDLVLLTVSKCSDKCAQNESIQCSPITADSLVLFTICYLNLIDSLRH